MLQPSYSSNHNIKNNILINFDETLLKDVKKFENKIDLLHLNILTNYFENFFPMAYFLTMKLIKFPS